MSDFDINVRAHLILYPGALHASESAIRENRGEFATGLENAGFFFTSDESPRAFFSLKAKNFERKTRVFRPR